MVGGQREEYFSSCLSRFISSGSCVKLEVDGKVGMYELARRRRWRGGRVGRWYGSEGELPGVPASYYCPCNAHPP